jgi:small-conductance mechanosensitive channel
MAWALRRTAARRGRANLGAVGGSLVKGAIYIAGFLLAATIVVPSLRPGDLIAGLGIGSVAIGFAFKDILQNMLAGVLILVRQPFEVGDQIVSSSGFEGTVEKIETRATLIRTYDNMRVVIPNSEIYTNSVTVKTAFDKVRGQYDVGIGCSDDWDEACAILLDAARKTEGVLSDPPPEALPWDLAESANIIRLRWWTKPQRADVVHVRSRLVRAIYPALDAAGIDQPYPTRVVLWHDQTETADGDRRRQREGWPAQGDDPKSRAQGRAEAQAAE